MREQDDCQRSQSCQADENIREIEHGNLLVLNAAMLQS